MRRILLTFMSTVAAVVTLFGYRTSTPHPVTATPVATGSAGSTDSTGTTATAGPRASAAAVTRKVSGQTSQTRWGPVQVQLTLAGTRITSVTLLQVPSGNSRDEEINAYAVPLLEQETVKAQGVGIDGVSGATVTSDGYVTSLQSALDKAGL